MSGSRRITLTISSKLRRIAVFPSMTTSGEGAWNRPPLLQLGNVPGVDLVSVSVPFVDRRGPVELGGRGLRVQLDRMCPEAHRRPLSLDRMLFWQQVDDRVRGLRIEFGTVRSLQAQHRAGEPYRRELEPKAHALEGDLVLRGESGRGDLPFDSAVSEATGHQNAVRILE